MSTEHAVTGAKDFPELRQLFSAYLHEDFGVEHGTAEAAVLAFKEESNQDELTRAIEELRALIGRGLSEQELEELLRWDLGSSYMPPKGEIASWLRSVLKTFESG